MARGNPATAGRPALFAEDPWRSVRHDGLARPCLGVDGQPLPSGDRNPLSQIWWRGCSGFKTPPRGALTCVIGCGAGCSARYKAVLVEGAGYYYETLLDYVHLHPVRAGLADRRKGQSVLDDAWSSVSGGIRGQLLKVAIAQLVTIKVAGFKS